MKRTTNVLSLACWASMNLASRGEQTEGYLVYENAPIDQDGQMYEPIPFNLVTRAARAAGVMTHALYDIKEATGLLWEINARWQNGEYDDINEYRSERIRELVCATHRHLGDRYDTFVAS